MTSLYKILNAGSIAVVGASENPDKMGHTLLHNIIAGGYEGTLYPINPSAETIMGKQCYKSILDVPGDIDLLVICVPAKLVCGIMEQAGQKGVKGAIVISGGFREIGNDALEEAMLAEAGKHGIRIFGPNCQGVNYTPARLCATWPVVTTQGPIGIVSQSGTIGACAELWAEKESLGVSCFAALGNKSDVSEEDFVEMFAEDESTKVICLNIEGFKDSERFIRTVAENSRKKPIVILKPGRTKLGAKAAQSHTKSIACNDKMFTAFCEKHGVLRAGDMTQFYDFAKGLAFLKKPAGQRVLIVTSSGGSGILAADVIEECGFELSPLPEDCREKLKEVLPDQCVISNPLDLTGDADAGRYLAALDVLAGEDCFDTALVIFGDPISGAAEVIGEIRGRMDKPVVVCYLGGGEVEEEETAKMHRAGIPVFPTPERAVRVIEAVCRRRGGNDGEQ